LRFSAVSALFCCSVFFIDAPEKEGRERKERRRGKEGADRIVVVARPLTPFLFFVLSSKWHPPSRALHGLECGLRVASCGLGLRAGVAGQGRIACVCFTSTESRRYDFVYLFSSWLVL
jgi:hypothetical protein